MRRPKVRDLKGKYIFADKVFRSPYAPYFDNYKDHVFVIVGEVDDHYDLRCVDDPSVGVDGWVEFDLLRRWEY